MLLDKDGHVKLSDFGLCKTLDYKYSTMLLDDEVLTIQESAKVEIEGLPGSDKSPWMMPKEKLQQWKRNRRALVLLRPIVWLRKYQIIDHGYATSLGLETPYGVHGVMFQIVFLMGLNMNIPFPKKYPKNIPVIQHLPFYMNSGLFLNAMIKDQYFVSGRL